MAQPYAGDRRRRFGAENLVQSPREGRLRVGDHMRIDVQRRDRAGVTKTLTDQVDRDSVR